MNPTKLLITLLTLITITSFRQPERIFLWYTDVLGTIKNCEGDSVEVALKIATNSLQKVKIYSFNIPNTNFRISRNQNDFSKSDTLALDKNTSVILKIKYKILNNNRPTQLTFKSNVEDSYENTVYLKYDQYYITNEDIQNRITQTIDISNSCNDSILVCFPDGGTISGATLYTDSSSSKKEYKSVTYGYGDPESFIKLTKKDIGNYYVEFGSCHWGNNFWLTVK